MQAPNGAQKRRWENVPETLPRKRARQSCETCKARKTKCVGVENGDCEYCRSLGVPCEVSLKSRKRPFYRVSEEAYDHLIKLLRRFVPEEELPDLTVENITAFLDRLDNGPLAQIPSDARRAADSNDAGSAPNPRGDRDHQKIMESKEHPLLQEELGCMVLDSSGTYRYVGPNSSLRWYHAVRMASARPPDPCVIVPLKTGLLPPTTPESPASQHRVEHYLPSHQLCMQYTARFFEQVHSMHSFYSPEQFYALLDHTLEDRGKTASSSWLCSLYSIFAIGSIRQNVTLSHSNKTLGDPKNASDYLALAKELVPVAAEEADIESVRAFALLSLAMHSNCYSVGAYLYLGTAARIGFSLGLHRDIFPRTLSIVDRERCRRTWWTVYILDHEMASRFGYPCAIADGMSFMKTSPASEQILDPSPNMPLGFQTLSVSLVQLQKKINFECFLEPSHAGGRLPINRVTQSLTTLRKWLDRVPHHLRWDSTVSTQHLRSIAVLHLRYWSSVISISRPFLLLLVTRSGEIESAARLNCYEKLCSTCIEAAEISVLILQRMRSENILSSLTLNDCHCTGEVMGVLILALQKAWSAKHQDMLRICLETVSSMERVGWCEKLVPDMETRVYESGVFDIEIQPGNQEQNMHSDGSGSPENVDLDLDNPQWDAFEILGLDSGTELMNIFPEAPFAAGMEHLF